MAASTLTQLPNRTDRFGCLEDPQVVAPSDGHSAAVAFFGSNCASPLKAPNRMVRTRHASAHALKVDDLDPGVWMAELPIQSSTWKVKSIADGKTPVPGGKDGETFVAVSSPGGGGTSSRMVAFVGLGNQGTMALYVMLPGGALHTVAKVGDTVSSASRITFNDFPEPPSVDGTRVAFLAHTSDDGQGVYVWDGASLMAAGQSPSALASPSSLYTKVVSSDTKVGSASVTYIGFAKDSLRLSRVAVYMVLSNSTYGIYNVDF